MSVVVPVYNGARFVGQALDSVFAQMHQPIEVLAIDDGSTDGSREILAAYGPRLRLLTQSNQGVGRARSAGIAAARGEFIAFLDQDDWWHPEKIARQVAALEADPQVGLVHTEVAYFNEARQAWVGPINPQATPERLIGDCYRELLQENHIRNSSVLVRTRVLRAVGPCDPAICGNTVQDYDLWLRIARQSRLAYLDQPLTIIRLHETQGTWDRRQMLAEEIRLLERLLGAEEQGLAAELGPRMAGAYEALGVAHLDAGEPRPARQCFRQAFGYRRSRRVALLYLATFAPPALLARLRGWRESFESRRGKELAPNLPAWARAKSTAESATGRAAGDSARP